MGSPTAWVVALFLVVSWPSDLTAQPSVHSVKGLLQAQRAWFHARGLAAPHWEEDYPAHPHVTRRLNHPSARRGHGWSSRIMTIVLDPGHGGHDPGAVGPNGLTEKEVALNIAIRLKHLLQANSAANVVLTREDDRFVSLDDRTVVANQEEASLLLSIHANSNLLTSLHGLEVFTLGQASDEGARATAARENSTDLAGVDFLAQILSDLSQEANRELALEMAHLTRQAFRQTLGRYTQRYVDHGVKQAPFYVLMHTQAPAILVEVAFLSNPDEAHRLTSPVYLAKIAEALFDALQRFLLSSAPDPARSPQGRG